FSMCFSIVREVTTSISAISRLALPWAIKAATSRSRSVRPVLATCGIRQPGLASKTPSSCLLLLADSQLSEYNRKHSLAHIHKGVTFYDAEDSHVHHAVDTLLSSVVPPSLRRLDQTRHHLASTGNGDRPFQEQVPTRGRK